MSDKRKRRARFTRAALVGVLAATASLVVTSAFAANVVGTAGKDTLRGSAKADKLIGKGGNDKLYGLAGNDVLSGGPGNDVLVGGPGKDILSCGPGRDIATADAQDKVGADCETIRGLPKPTLSVADASVEEGNSGSRALTFSIVLANASPKPVTVSYATADGSAAAGSDYTAASGKLVFAPGAKSKKVDVAIVGDTVVEQDETFTIRLSNPVNATLSNASATGTIRNDDVAPRSGHYAGATSQGKSIAFDVAPDVASMSNLNMLVNMTCTEVAVVVPDVPFDMTGVTFPIAPDWSFGFSVPVSDPEFTANFMFRGALSLSGPATGTVRVDMTLLNLPGVGDVHCSTGDVTWTASPPA